MPPLLPVLLRLVTATSFFAVCCFLYEQQLKSSRKKHRIQNYEQVGQILQKEEVKIQTATHETKKPLGNNNSYGLLPNSSFLRTYLPGGRTSIYPGSGAGIGIASVSHALHPRSTFSGTEIGTFGLLYTYQVVRAHRMQQQHFGEVQPCSPNLEETLKEESCQDGHVHPTPNDENHPTMAAWPHLSPEEQPMSNSSIQIQNEAHDPKDELLDSATLMTFISDTELAPPTEIPLASIRVNVTETDSESLEANKTENVDQSAISPEDFGMQSENLVCHTPESDRGIETLGDTYNEDSSTSEEYDYEEENVTSSYYSGNFPLQREREPFVFWNKDFQDLDWHQRACSPIAEELDEDFSSSGSSITDSSSDLVYETIFSTSQNPEEINDYDLADLKDDPDFVQLLLQSNDQDSKSQCQLTEELEISSASDTKQPKEECHWFEEVKASSNSNITQLLEEGSSSKETMLMLVDELHLSRRECFGGQDGQSQILEKFATQLTNSIITEAHSRIVGNRPCKSLADTSDNQDDSSIIGFFSSELAEDIITKAIKTFIYTDIHCKTLVHISEAQNRDFGKGSSHSSTLPIFDFCDNQDAHFSIENLTSNLAKDIISQAIRRITYAEIQREICFQSNTPQTTSIRDTMAVFHSELDLPIRDMCTGDDGQSPIEDMAFHLGEDIIMEAQKNVVSLKKYCENVVEKCIKEVCIDFVKLRHLSQPSSSIESYGWKLAMSIVNSSICQVKRNILGNLKIKKEKVVKHSRSQCFEEKSLEGHSPKYHKFEISMSSRELGERRPEMLSSSTQTDFPALHLFGEKSSPSKPSLHNCNLRSETIARIPKQLRYKVWKKLMKSKRKYQCYKKHKKKPEEGFFGYFPESYVTQVSDTQTALETLVLAHSLRKAKTSRDICILLDDEVSPDLRQLLADVYDHVYLTSELCSSDDLALSLLGRPELSVTFTKLHCWRLTQYQKCVYLDADTLVLDNCDELFDRDELSAVPDTGWPDCFNSGVFVFRPSLDTYAKLVSLALSKGSFDGGDQGLLNTYFGSWRSDISRRLPFTYNMVSNVSYTYAPAYRHFASGVKIVHFLGADKPWLVRWRTDNGTVELGEHQSWDLHVPFLQSWCGIFREKVLPKLSEAAKTYVHKSTWMTVNELFYRISTGDIYMHEECEKTTNEPPAVTHYPSHEISHPLERTPEPPEVPKRWSAAPPPHLSLASPLPESSSESSVPPSSPPPESPSQIDAMSTKPSLSNDHIEPRVESKHQETITEEPSEPHFEALLWHSVRSPWEPPPPPPPEEYQPPPSQQYHEPCDSSPTFGWFSADSGARSPLEAYSPEPQESPSKNEPETPSLEGAAESSIETAEEDFGSTSGTDSLQRMRSWEEGNIDYLGKDKFDNIWKKLEFRFTAPEPKSELENLKDSLKDSFALGSMDQFGSVASSSLLDEDDSETLVPDDTPEPAASWQGYPEGDYSGMFEWQEGRIDYCGKDGSDNILRRLDFVISGGPVENGD